MKKKVMLEIARGLIILLFAYASLSKLLQFTKFIQQLDNQPLPNAWTPFLAPGIPAAEMLVIVLLTIPTWWRWGFLLSALIMFLFTIYTALILLHGFSYIPCSCGGVIEQLTWKQHLVFNALFLTLSLVGSLLSNQRNKRESKGI